MDANIVLSEFYRLVNVPEITDEITGGIWKIKKPAGRNEEDIVINIPVFSHTNNGHLFTGVVNINIYTKELSTHTPNMSRMQFITEKVLSVLDLQFGERNAGLLNFRMASQNYYPDAAEETAFFTNLRLNYSFKN